LRRADFSSELARWENDFALFTRKKYFSSPPSLLGGAYVSDAPITTSTEQARWGASGVSPVF
jgi:hypothetical protein